VPTYPDYLEAPRGGASRRRVRCVRNHLQITLPPGDYRDDRALTALDDRGGASKGSMTDSMKIRVSCGWDSSTCRAGRTADPAPLAARISQSGWPGLQLFRRGVN
jgi:hypothetical protein